MTLLRNRTKEANVHIPYRLTPRSAPGGVTQSNKRGPQSVPTLNNGNDRSNGVAMCTGRGVTQSNNRVQRSVPTLKFIINILE